jgi:hypothetical protein
LRKFDKGNMHIRAAERCEQTVCPHRSFYTTIPSRNADCSSGVFPGRVCSKILMLQQRVIGFIEAA